MAPRGSLMGVPHCSRCVAVSRRGEDPSAKQGEGKGSGPVRVKLRYGWETPRFGTVPSGRWGGQVGGPRRSRGASPNRTRPGKVRRPPRPRASGNGNDTRCGPPAGRGPSPAVSSASLAWGRLGLPTRGGAFGWRSRPCSRRPRSSLTTKHTRVVADRSSAEFLTTRARPMAGVRLRPRPVADDAWRLRRGLGCTEV